MTSAKSETGRQEDFGIDERNGALDNEAVGFARLPHSVSGKSRLVFHAVRVQVILELLAGVLSNVRTNDRDHFGDSLHIDHPDL
jgi:hypothetical protein